jgi:hypothetical protein
MFAARGLFGAGSVKPNLSDHDLFDFNTGTSDAEAYLLFYTDGTLLTHTDNFGNTLITREWMTGVISPSEAALYELVVSVTSGFLSYGTSGTFNLGTARQIGCHVNANAGSKFASGTVQIRRAADSLVMASAGFSFDVSSTNV